MDLWTKEGKKLEGTPWNVYPRPQMVRGNWGCLNGEWEFETVIGSGLPEEYSQTIQVPFCPESLLSRIHNIYPAGTVFCYRTTFEMSHKLEEGRLLLHFGAVDQIAEVYINETPVVRHRGGYLPFHCDITRYVREGENEIIVRVNDDLDHRYPYGKQSYKRGGMWYTPVSGIWQTVWMEVVPEEYIEGLHIHCGKDYAEITVDGASSGFILCDGRTYQIANGSARIEPKEPHLWSPEDPFLYNIEIHCGDDVVSSYFALRTISVKKKEGRLRLCLNGQPYFFNGLLDQGYWSDGIYTPADPSMYEKDILFAKSLGFNTLRKHIKVEPEQFYYDCDRLGMIVFQDIVNNGEYHFISDSVLPLIGLTKKDDTEGTDNPEAEDEFLKHMKAEVRHLANHPCILYWTIFNEGWGQFNADEAYAILIEEDSSRLVDATSGWFRQKKSDVESHHVYFRKFKIKSIAEPQVLSEFGGYCYKISDHSTNDKRTFGYRKCKTHTDFVRDLRRLYKEQIIPAAKAGLCAAIYTQLSDIEDETNGLITYDRAEKKVLPSDLLDISELLQKAVSDKL